MAIKVMIVVCFGLRMYTEVYRQRCDLQIPFLRGVDLINSRKRFTLCRYPYLKKGRLITRRRGLLCAGTLDLL